MESAHKFTDMAKLCIFFTHVFTCRSFSRVLQCTLFKVSLSPVHTSNNVEATFDIVAFDNVASTLLLVWTGPYVIFFGVHNDSQSPPGRCCGVFAISAPRYKWLYLLTYLLTYLFGSVNRRLAWQLYNRDLYRHKDDISVICELLAVKHGDIELDLFSNSVLVAFIEFLCTK